MRNHKIIASFLICMLLLTAGTAVSAAEMHQATIDSITVSGTSVTVNGTVRAVDGVVKSGQQVTMFVLEPGMDAEQITPQDFIDNLSSIGETMLTTTTGTDGSFTFQFTQPSSAAFGLFPLYVGGTFIQTPCRSEYYYVQRSIEETIINAVNAASSAEQMAQVLDTEMTAGGSTATYKEILTLTENAGYDNLADKTNVLSALVNKGFQSADAIRVTFNEAVAVERVNQAGSVSEMQAVIAEQSSQLQLDLGQAFAAVTDKDAVYQALLNQGFASTAEIAQAFDRAAAVQLQEEHPIAHPDISLSGGSGSSGKIIPVALQFSQDFAIDGFYIHMRYDAENLRVPDKSDIVINPEFAKSENGKTQSVDISGDGEITVSVSSVASPAMCSVKELLTANMTIASNADAGKYPVTVDGYFTVFDDNLGLLRKVYIDTESAGITVSASHSTGGSGGGGTGGGGGIGGNLVPSNPVTPDVDTEPEPDEPAPVVFADAQSIPSWAKVMVEQLTQKQIINGIANEHGALEFRPGDPVTRAQFVKMLVLAFDLGETGEGDVSFDDVTEADWYYPYIAGAVNAGIVNGIGDNLFGADINISRQDMAVMLDRVLDAKGLQLDPVITPVVFEDEAEIASYARESIRELQSARILEGSEGHFYPNRSATRAESAKVIYELMVRSK